jgi:hypothetical protein
MQSLFLKIFLMVLVGDVANLYRLLAVGYAGF